MRGLSGAGGAVLKCDNGSDHISDFIKYHDTRARRYLIPHQLIWIKSLSKPVAGAAGQCRGQRA